MNPFRIPRTPAEAVSLGIVHGAWLCALLVVFVFASGSTFGQRCERAHPGDDAAAARCVERLAHGTQGT